LFVVGVGAKKTEVATIRTMMVRAVTIRSVFCFRFIDITQMSNLLSFALILIISMLLTKII